MCCDSGDLTRVNFVQFPSTAGQSLLELTRRHRENETVSDLVAVRDRARLGGPAARNPAVGRTRLDQHYVAATGKVLRVLAPAGYGKSTIVARWVDNDPRPVRWLDLESIDNDPMVFRHALVRGLGDLGGAQPDVAEVHDIGHFVADLSESFVLVLDDIHLVNSGASTALIDRMIKHLPIGSTLVLVGRAHYHSATIGRFRLNPGVVDVTADDLAFDLAETEQLLTSMGIESDINLLTELNDQFEGWPAGLRLASVVMNLSGRDLDVPVDRLGDLTYVTEYITEEWFGRLHESDQRFLTELGCFGRFTGEKCDFVLGTRDSAATLKRLCSDELILSALDQRGEWYRLHPLLRRWLSSRLRSGDSERWREIHVTAAHWWERRGDIDLAIEHAHDAGDLELCESLVLQHSGAFYARGMHPTVARWIAHFSDDRIQSSPGLRVVASLLALQVGDGDRALKWARLAWQANDETGDTSDGTAFALRRQIEVLHAAVDTRPATELIPIALHARRNLDPGPWHCFAGYALGGNQFVGGDERAVDTLRETLFEAEIAGLTSMHANTAATLAIVLDLGGRRDETEGLAALADRLLKSVPGESFAAATMTAAINSLVAARAGRHDSASELIAACLKTIDRHDRCAPWFNILALTTLTRTCLLLDDAQTARDLLQRLDQKMESQARDTPIAAHIDVLHDDVRRAFELLADRSWSLTAAELRVAQYLPTNLSLAEIATRLFVSRNTVKSHATAIYRKLGTNSRSEAVELARRAGLIDDTAPSV